MKLYDIYLRHPFSMIVAGPSGSGKTVWIKQLFTGAHSYCNIPPQEVIFFYSEYQDIFSTLSGVKFIQGLSETVLNKIDGSVPTWIIIDDLMHESMNSKIVSELFTKGSHHRNITVILLIQNLFMRGLESRNITLNANYLVMFKNTRDKSIITNIGKQMFPGSARKFRQIFETATEKPYSYLFIDNKTDTPDEVRMLTNILGETELIHAYQI